MRDPVEIQIQLWLNPETEDAQYGYEAAMDAWSRRASGATVDQAAREIVEHLLNVDVTCGRSAMGEAALGAISFLLGVAVVPVSPGGTA